MLLIPYFLTLLSSVLYLCSLFSNARTVPLNPIYSESWIVLFPGAAQQSITSILDSTFRFLNRSHAGRQLDLLCITTLLSKILLPSSLLHNSEYWGYVRSYTPSIIRSLTPYFSNPSTLSPSRTLICTLSLTILLFMGIFKRCQFLKIILLSCPPPTILPVFTYSPTITQKRYLSPMVVFQLYQRVFLRSSRRSRLLEQVERREWEEGMLREKSLEQTIDFICVPDSRMVRRWRASFLYFNIDQIITEVNLKGREGRIGMEGKRSNLSGLF